MKCKVTGIFILIFLPEMEEYRTSLLSLEELSESELEESESDEESFLLDFFFFFLLLPFFFLLFLSFVFFFLSLFPLFFFLLFFLDFFVFLSSGLELLLPDDEALLCLFPPASLLPLLLASGDSDRFLAFFCSFSLILGELSGVITKRTKRKLDTFFCVQKVIGFICASLCASGIYQHVFWLGALLKKRGGHYTPPKK